MMTPSKQILISIVVLGLALLYFETTSADIWLQNLLFDASSKRWFIDAPGKILSFVFYDGIKKLLILFALAILISLLFFRKKAFVRHYNRGLRIVLLSLIIVPSVTGLLKATTNVACPRDIIAYGGSIPYIRVFETYPPASKPETMQRCFPAGHASGGFALMSLFFLFHSKKNRRRGLLLGLTIGWLMGTYKMLLGHHFLSHTVITMLMAWLLINLIVLLDDFVVRKITPLAQPDTGKTS
jgi:membrane-associated PAP2 superfamily phosphatase